MPAIIIPSRWTKQPTGLVEVDRSHPLANQLAYAFAGNNLTNETLVGTKQFASSNGIVRGFGSTVGVGTTDKITTPLIEGSVLTTIFAVVDKRGNGGGGLGRITQNAMGSIIQAGGAGANRLFVNHSTTQGVWFLPDLLTGFSGACAVTHDASSNANLPRCWLKGVEGTVTVSTAPVGTRTTTATAVNIGNVVAGTGVFDGYIGPYYLFRRVLSPAEVVELTRNPWQIFKPLVRRIYFNVAFNPAWARNRNSLVQAGMTL